MTTVRVALMLSLVERYLQIALALGSSVVLARLLTPEQIGIYSVSLAVIGIAQVLRDFGISSYLIQEAHLTDDHIRTALGLSLVMGAGLFLLIFAAAPWAGQLYAEPRMVGTLQISALNFLILPFCSISLALLRREMQFQRILYVTTAAAVLSTVVTVSLAVMDFGPNSMAVGAVANNISLGFGAWLARPTKALLMPGFKQWRALLKFGGQSSLSGIVTTVSLDANDLIVGKVLGFHPVAIISRAQGLMNMFNRDLLQAIRGVALPAFAAAHRNDQDLEAHYAHATAIILALAWPFYGLLSLYALEALRLLYGAQWDTAAPLVPIFCLAGAIAAINALTTSALIAIGEVGRVTSFDLLMQPLRVLLIGLAAVLIRTPEACALAYLLSAVVSLPVFLKIKEVVIPTDMSRAWLNLASTVAVTATTLAPAAGHVFMMRGAVHEPLPLLQVVGVVGLSVLLWFAAVIVFKHPISREPAFERVKVMAFGILRLGPQRPKPE